jgi:phospholipid/cholesterol/gamma-HCH transport system substrate-binding protein
VQMNASIDGISQRLAYETLPRVNALTADVSDAARSFDRAASVFSSSPRSVLFGVGPAAPGPGEPGFAWPAAAPASHSASR